MRSDRSVEGGQESSHPRAVLFEHAIPQDRDREGEVLIEKAPARLSDRRSVEWSEAAGNAFDRWIKPEVVDVLHLSFAVGYSWCLSRKHNLTRARITTN
jgi:hypothetical protein